MLQLKEKTYYKTRDGQKARAIGEMDKSLGDDGDFAVQVGGEVHRYKSDGRWQYSGVSDALDLVAEWQEPVTFERWIYFLRYSDGRVSAIVDEEEPSQRYFSGKVIARRQITITEGEGIAN